MVTLMPQSPCRSLVRSFAFRLIVLRFVGLSTGDRGPWPALLTAAKRSSRLPREPKHHQIAVPPAPYSPQPGEPQEPSQKNDSRQQLGNRKILDEAGIDPGDIAQQAEHLRAKGQTVMFVAVVGKPAGLLGVADLFEFILGPGRLRGGFGVLGQLLTLGACVVTR